MTLKEPIVDGAYYERYNGSVVGPAASKGDGWWELAGYWYKSNGLSTAVPRVCGHDLRCRVYLVPTDPAEVVAELQRMAHICSASVESAGSRAFDTAADLVAEKLGVNERPTLCWCGAFGEDRCPRHSKKLGVKP